MIVLNPRKLEKSESDKLIVAKREWLLRSLNGRLPIKIYLFGSGARNQLTEKSDLDFALIYNTTYEIDLAKKALYQTPREDNWPMDFLFYTQEELTTRAQVGGAAFIILKEGILIFEKPRE